jgi:hypothetical protein
MEMSFTLGAGPPEPSRSSGVAFRWALYRVYITLDVKHSVKVNLFLSPLSLDHRNFPDAF